MSRNEQIETVRQQSVEVNTFLNVDLSNLKCPSIAVFIQPEDYPDSILARVFEGQQPTNIILFRDTLEEVREDIMKAFPGMMRFDRMENDYKSVAEVWV